MQLVGCRREHPVDLQLHVAGHAIGASRLIQRLASFLDKSTRGLDATLRQIERLIGRLANMYSYMIFLYAYLANQVNEAKLEGDMRLKDKLIRKKDAIYELSRGIRYKHEACSRMLTAALGYEESKVFERADGRGREKRMGKKKMPGWEGV